jgi:HD-GYP domain-containing protein (c-di-GMP phosphodiesterase class II)
MIEHIQAVINAEKSTTNYLDYLGLIDRLDVIFNSIEQKNSVPKLVARVILNKLYSSYQQYIGFISDGTKQNHSLARRAINTAIVVSFITRQLGLMENQRVQIIEGALFHDIGMLLAPKSIMASANPLSDLEKRHIIAHPVHGYQLLRETFQDVVQNIEAASSIVLQHHERWDGTGYPQKLANETIELGARIVAIADAYTAMVSERTYRSAISCHKAMVTLMSGSAGHFDETILKAFARSIGVYPPSSIVLLNNGELARVVESETLMQPQIRILVDQRGKHVYSDRNNTLVKLSIQKELSIKKVFEPEEISLPAEDNGTEAAHKLVS